MTINKELREEVIKEYVAKKDSEHSKTINDNMKKAIVILALIFGAAFSIEAYLYVFVGRFSDATMTFGIGLIISSLLLLIASGIVWFALRKAASKGTRMNEDILRRTVCMIEDGNLIKKVVGGGGGRPRSFKLEKIRNLAKEDNVVSFEYENQEIELLDYYEPSLFERLKERIEAHLK